MSIFKCTCGLLVVTYFPSFLFQVKKLISLAGPHAGTASVPFCGVSSMPEIKSMQFTVLFIFLWFYLSCIIILLNSCPEKVGGYSCEDCCDYSSVLLSDLISSFAVWHHLRTCGCFNEVRDIQRIYAGMLYSFVMSL